MKTISLLFLGDVKISITYAIIDSLTILLLTDQLNCILFLTGNVSKLNLVVTDSCGMKWKIFGIFRSLPTKIWFCFYHSYRSLEAFKRRQWLYWLHYLCFSDRFCYKALRIVRCFLTVYHHLTGSHHWACWRSKEGYTRKLDSYQTSYERYT